MGVSPRLLLSSAFPFLPRFGPGSDGFGNFTPSQRSKYQPLEGVLHHFGPEKNNSKHCSDG